MFQFTHPGKGATDQRDESVIKVVVSIHTPWEGCDRLLAKIIEDTSQFQFTHPGKGATKQHFCNIRIAWFQFTHPGKGATFVQVGHGQ